MAEGSRPGYRALVVLLLLGAGLRFFGIWYGLPFSLVSDEESLIGGALRMLELRSLIPAFHPEAMSILNYPVILPYIYLVFFVPYLGVLYLVTGAGPVNEFAFMVFDHMGMIFALARTTSVVFGVATIYLVYRLGREMLGSHAAGLIAAAFLAVDFLSSFTAHFARHWNLTILIVVYTVLVSWRIYRDGSPRDYVKAGLAGGIGFGVSYSFGCLGLVACAIAHVAAKGWHGLVNRNIIVTGVIFLVCAILFFLLHPNAVLRQVIGGVSGLDDSKSVLGWVDAIAFYSRALWFSNPAVTVLATIGAGVALAERRITIAVGAVGSYLFMVSVLYFTVTLEGRYIHIAMPFLTLSTGYGIARIYECLSANRIAKIAAMVPATAGFAFSLFVSANATWMLTQTDTRFLALDWIQENIPAGSRIVVDLGAVRLEPTGESLREQNEFDSGSLGAYERMMLRRLNGGGPDPRGDIPLFHVLNTSRLSPDLVEEAHAENFLPEILRRDYVYFVGQYRDPAYISPLHAEIAKKGELLARFQATDGDPQPPYLKSTIVLPYPMHRLFGMRRFGPIVEVFALPRNSH